MLARMMRSPLWSASLLVGLGLIMESCGASTPAIAVTSPTLTPSPSPTATISPTATATSVVNAACYSASSNVTVTFVNPPGPLLTTIPSGTLPLPPGTLVAQPGMGIQAGSVEYTLCTPGATPAAITAFMDSALPAAGWMRNSVPACNAYHGYPWYKGKYGMDIVVDVNSSMPDLWALLICPHVGEY